MAEKSDVIAMQVFAVEAVDVTAHNHIDFGEVSDLSFHYSSTVLNSG